MRDFRIWLANKLFNLPHPVGKWLFHKIIPWSKCKRCGHGNCGITAVDCREMGKLRLFQ